MNNYVDRQTELNAQLFNKGRIPLQNQMNFWKSVKGGGVIFNPKVYIADFGNFKQGFLSMKMIKRRVISGFRVCCRVQTTRADLD